MPHIQLFLVKEILQALMITEYLKPRTIQIVSPQLQNEYYSCQLQIMSRIIPFVYFKLSRRISVATAKINRVATNIFILKRKGMPANHKTKQRSHDQRKKG